ncbi:MAG: CSLREA domain-containing protein, partial [Acidimicrobiales bacterium]|nr:CSLREA domain-containing protein [Acidimicrobiales bacterium]
MALAVISATITARALLAVPTITVNSTADVADINPGDGLCDTGGTNAVGQPECTLRAAISELNANAGVTNIDFSIPVADPGHSGGIWTILPTTMFEMITRTVDLDATTQPGFVGTPVIELDGSASGVNSGAIYLRSNNSEVRGFIVHGFPDEGLEIDGTTGAGNNNILAGNWVGIDENGVVDGNIGNQILLSEGVTGNVLGGPNPEDANIIGGGTLAGIALQDVGTSNNTIQGNYLGVMADGTTPVPIGSHAIRIFDGAGGNRIEDNTIVGNTGDGIHLSTTAAGANAFVGNTIHSNGELGIDLNADEVTANDSGDGDGGPNDLLNFPVITSASESAGTVSVDYTLDLPAGDYHIEFFTNPSGIDPSGHGEGETLVHTHSVLSHPGGSAPYSTSYAGSGTAVLTATTTVDAGGGSLLSTSEFSAAAIVSTTKAVVNSTGDGADLSIGDGLCNTGALNVSGAPECTLRAAVQESNASAVDLVEFNVPAADPGHSSGIWRIAPSTALPAVTSPVTIDGQTQPGWTLTPVIEIDGTAVGSSAPGLDIQATAPSSTLRGVALFDFPAAGIAVYSTDSTITGTYVGIEADGTTPGANGLSGIIIAGDRSTVGGPSGVDRVVSSGNVGDGIEINVATSVTVDGAYVGTDATGLTPVPNGGRGIDIATADGVDIGLSQSNVVSANTSQGIRIRSSSSNVTVANSFIGVGSDGTTPLGNLEDGVDVKADSAAVFIGTLGNGNVIGDNGLHGVLNNAAGDNLRIWDNAIGTDASGTINLGNGGSGVYVDSALAFTTIHQSTIAYNSGDGVTVLPSVTGTVAVSSSLLYGNGGLGIDLLDDGPTANDVGDVDAGPNDLLNYPEITAVTDVGGGSVTVDFDLDVPAGNYAAYIYLNPSGSDPSGYGEGEVLARTEVVAHPGGTANYTSGTFLAGAGSTLSAHLYENGTPYRTSEFSPTVSYLGVAVVNSTADAVDLLPGDGVCDTGNLNSEGDPECTHRAAIAEANASVGINRLEYNIPVSDLGHSAGVWTFIPATDYPVFSQPITLDATTQPGFAGDPIIQLDGSAVVSSSAGIMLQTDDSVVRGFIVHSFIDEGIEADGLLGSANRNTIAGNWVGIDANFNPAPNGDNGILVARDAVDNVVGGPDPEDANVVGHNGGAGIGLRLAGVEDNTIQGNYVGVLPDGVTPIPNTVAGVLIRDAAANNTVIDNTIKSNTGPGVLITATSGSGHSILQNVIAGNGGIGIDLGTTGVNANDVGDGDIGPNNLLNFPLITSAVESGGTATIDFDLDVPAGDYHIEFFTNPSGADPSGHGEGEILVHSYAVTGHPGGSASYSTTYAGSAGDLLSATTTEQLAGPTYRSTSEFSAVATVYATTALVNSTSDGSDSTPGDGVCWTGGTNVDSDPECTLRAAIEEANASTPLNDIAFNIPTGDSGHTAGVWTISPTSELPSFTDTVDLDATSQPGWIADPIIELDGASAGAGLDAGLRLDADDSTIQGISVINWSGDGIEIDGVNSKGDNNTIINNWIGVAADGSAGPNLAMAILVVSGADNNEIGQPGAGNLIANNLYDGVRLAGTTNIGNAIRGNSIYNNTQFGIDLGGDGVTANDAGDIDSGHNDLLNFPEISSIVDTGATTTVLFTIDAPDGPYIVDFYANPAGADPSGFGEGQLPLVEWTTPNHTNPSPVYSHTIVASVGDIISSTLTEGTTASPGSTSEFSAVTIVSSTTAMVNSTGDTADNNPGDGACWTGGVNVDGDPECTLRAAIEEANASTLLNDIAFNIPTGDSGHTAGVWTISPSSQLPDVTQTVTIDATTQPGWTATPVVELDGAGAGGGSIGIRISGNNVEIRGFAIGGFSGNGIRVLAASSGSLIAGNHIGLDATGFVPRGNGGRGVELRSGSGPTTIGGMTPADRNVISGNSSSGIIVFDSDNNVIIGNFIGTDVTGNASGAGIGNTGDGISVDGGSAGTTVGLPGAGNVLSGNTDDGIEIGGVGGIVTNTVLTANMIGLGQDGTTEVANGRHGVVLYNTATSTQIGGTTVGEENVISGNTDTGIVIDGNAGADTTANVVNGNLIGTDATGTLNRGNGSHGINVFGAAEGTLIGGTTAADANVISGNGGDGVRLDTATLNTLIYRNLIGVGLDGVTPIGNVGNGISLNAGVQDTRIGWFSGNGNVIGDNGGHGVLIQGASTGNSVRSNYIGTDVSRTIDLGNDGAGVHIDSMAVTSTVVTSWIAYNGGDGIDVSANVALASLLDNSVWLNGGLGIDIGPDGPTPNDAGDVDSGTNGLLNYPEIIGFTEVGTNQFTVDVFIDAPADTYALYLFKNPTGADPSGYGEAQNRVVLESVVHPGGSATYTTANISILPGDVLTAHLAVNVGGYASELSPNFDLGAAHVVNAPADPNSAENDFVSATPTVTPGGTAPIVWTATGLPPGITINTSTGEMSGTPDFDAAGSYSVTVTATSSDAPSGNDTFAWTITDTNRPPVVTNPGNQSNTDGDVVSFFVAASDPDTGASLTWSATNLPTGVGINPTTGEISGTVSTLVTATLNSSVTVTDGIDNDVVNFDWDVVPSNLPPVITTAWTTSTFGEGSNVTFAILATDPEGGALTYTGPGLPAGITLNPSTGAAGGTVGANAVGVYPVTFTVTDDGGLTDTHLITFTVTQTNSTPIVTALPDRSDAEFDVISLPVAASDPDDEDTLTYSATNLPDGLSINPATGLISGTLSITSSGSYSVDVTATDDGSPVDSATTSFTWDVTDVNLPPTITTVWTGLGVGEDQVVSVTLTATDPEGLALTWSATGLPTGLSINPTSGEVSGTVDPNAGGVWPVIFTVTDVGGLTDTHGANFTVSKTNSQPLLTNPGNQSNDEDDIVSLPIVASDPDSEDTLTYSATGLPDGLTIDPISGLISGTLTFDSAGSHSVTVTVTDDGTPIRDRSVVLTWDVNNKNRVVNITYPGDQTNVEGDVINLPVIGVDPDGDTITWSASNLPDGLSIDSVSGVISGTLTYDSAGSYSSSVTAFDGTNSSAVFFTWTVTNTNRSPIVDPIADQTNAETDIISLTATGSDPDGDTITWTATGLPDGLTINPVSGDITGTLTYDSAGSHSINITATDNGTPTLADTQTFTWTITNTNRPPVLDPIGNSSSNELTLIAFTATGSDPDVDGLTFTLAGQPTGAAITVGGDFTWIPSESQGPASYTFDVIVTDNGVPALSDTETIILTITETNQAPTVTNPGDQTNVEGQTVSITVTATDSDIPANSLTYTAAGLPLGLSVNAVTGEISGVLSFASDGTYSTDVTVTDNGTPALSDTTTFTWTVNETDPPTSPLDISKISDGGGTVFAGDVITYTITVTNSDSVEHTNATVSDAVPAGTTYVGGSTSVTAPVSTPADVRDDFNAVSYAGSDGSQPWLGSWDEVGETTDPTADDWQVLQDGAFPQYSLRKSGVQGVAIQRAADLSAMPIATLDFSYRREALNSNNQVQVQVSSNGFAGPWIPVFDIAGQGSPVTDVAYIPVSIDITPIRSANTAVRFIENGGANMGSSEVWLADVAFNGVTRSLSTGAGGTPPTVATGHNLFPGETLTATFQVTVDAPPSVTTVTNTASASSDQQPVGESAVVFDTVQNRPPVLDPIGDSSSAEQTLLAFTATGSDPDSNGLSYRLSGAPTGAAMTAGGDFTWIRSESLGRASYSFD